MRKESAVRHASQGRIYTLAQNGTGKVVKSNGKPQIIVSGNGSELTNPESRAKRKLITQKMTLSLIDVVRAKGEPERKQAYWNTFHCQNKIVSSGGKLYGIYCKNRFCAVCCGNRKADIVNRYLPILNTWEDPFFVTLTAKSVSAKSLKKRMKDMIRGFRIIHARFKKRHQRGKGSKFIGIKSLECNFNPEKKTYNPHFHLIVSNEETAIALVKEWINLCTKNGSPEFRKFADRKGQFTERVNSKESTLVEIVKYGSKIFTAPDVDKKARKKVPPHIYVAALDNILCAMKGLRIFERFGFNLPEKRVLKKRGFQILDQYEEWEYISKQTDWVNAETDKVLTEYLPPPRLTNLLANNIDTMLE